MQEKPVGVKIVDMCKYIDANVYRTDLNEFDKNTIYLYLYWIVYSICSNKKYLTGKEDLDSFATFFSEQLYNRYMNPKQFTDPPELNKITSVLNYIKSIMRGRIINWQQDHKFSVVLESNETKELYSTGNFIDSILYKEELKRYIENFSRKDMIEDILDEIELLPETILNVCKNNRFGTNKEMVYKLYMSCLLTFLNSVTLPKELQDKKDDDILSEKLEARVRKKELENSIILWHLPEELKDFVKVLMNRIRQEFTTSLYQTYNSYTVSDYVTGSILTVQDGKGRVYE